ncbi:hypothetical protein LguiA_028846 [Lonicera macranthoides]
MFQMALPFMSFSSKIVVLFLVVSAVSLPYRSSGDGSSQKENTLAMIKPDGLAGNYTSVIKKIILESGFSIPREMVAQLDEHSVKSFYAEHSSKSFFPSLVKYMTSGPVLIMVLEKVHAVSEWRTLIGPTDAHKARFTHPNSIRAICGLNSQSNCVHGSDSPESAAREISFFFNETLPAAGEFVPEHDEL